MKRLLLLTIMAALCLCPMDAQKQKRSGKRPAKESTEAKAERLFNEAEDFYFGTDKVFMNREKAAELYRQSAELGYPPAMERLGVGYHDADMGLEKDSEKCIYWLRKAAEAGNAYGQWCLSACYREGFGVPKDEEQSMYWTKLSAENGMADSQYGLGLLFNLDDNEISPKLKAAGYKHDLKQAEYWLTKAAEQEHVDAYMALAKLYYKTGDSEKMVQWAIKAADKNIPEAVNLCGTMMYSGFGGFPEDKENALKYLSKAVNMLDKYPDESQWLVLLRLGQCYYYGNGTKENHNLAFKYFSMMPGEAYSSYCDVPYYLGDYYSGLHNVTIIDNYKALEFYRIAMENGSQWGKLKYAVGIWKGTAGKPNRRKGLKMIKELAREGFPVAISFLNEIGQKY